MSLSSPRSAQPAAQGRTTRTQQIACISQRSWLASPGSSKMLPSASRPKRTGCCATKDVCSPCQDTQCRCMSSDAERRAAGRQPEGHAAGSMSSHAPKSLTATNSYRRVNVWQGGAQGSFWRATVVLMHWMWWAAMLARWGRIADTALLDARSLPDT